MTHAETLVYNSTEIMIPARECIRLIEQAKQSQRGATLEALNNYSIKKSGHVMPADLQCLVLYTTVDEEVQV